jgi:hypothetical protein
MRLRKRRLEVQVLWLEDERVICSRDQHHVE